MGFGFPEDFRFFVKPTIGISLGFCGGTPNDVKPNRDTDKEWPAVHFLTMPLKS